jgi:hypothetical protein
MTRTAAPRYSAHPKQPSARGGNLPIVIVLAVYLIAASVVSFLCDDAFITFRYADNLANGHGPVYNIGERVEGYTNFLWMLLMAAVIKLGGAPELWSRIFSIACGAGILLMLMLWGKQRADDWKYCTLLPFFLACTAPFIVWSTGGLETAAYGFLLLGSVIAVVRTDQDDSSRSAMLAGALAGLAILTRPDGVIIAGISGLFLLTSVIRRKISLTTLMAYAVPLAIIFGSHLLWRRSYYGLWLPNTFYVKTPSTEFLSFGFAYLGRFGWESALWFALLAVAFLNASGKRWRMNATILYLLVIAVVFSAYVVYTGGDFMVMGRFMVPLLGIIYLLFFELIALPGAFPRNALIFSAALLVLYLGYSGILLKQAHKVKPLGGLDSIGLLKDYHKKWTDAGMLLKAVARPTDTVLTSAAGIIPYYTGLHTIDLLGLTAPNLSKYRARPGVRRPGHALSITPQAFLDAKPQFFVGHPHIGSVDSAYIGWGTLQDIQDQILTAYHMGSIPLIADQRRHLYLLLRNDVIDRLPAGSRVR